MAAVVIDRPPSALAIYPAACNIGGIRLRAAFLFNPLSKINLRFMKKP
jgi:hypothetical protein